MSTGRVLALLELLQSGGLRTVPELAKRLGVDERTVRRNIAQLAELDVAVESVRGRYGGYRLAPGNRMPPLMLTDDEAVAVLLGLAAGQRTGVLAAETASSKLRRALPARLEQHLSALIDSLEFTAPAPEVTPIPAALLLGVADAVRNRHPLQIGYTDSEGRRTDRTVHGYGLVAHFGHWYLVAAGADGVAPRNFRLDRIIDARSLVGSFRAPDDFDAATFVATSLATAPYRHHVRLRIQADEAQLRRFLPTGVAQIGEPDADGWRLVELRAESLDWLPPLIAAIDRPFIVEHPTELTMELRALGERLTRRARAL